MGGMVTDVCDRMVAAEEPVPIGIEATLAVRGVRGVCVPEDGVWSPGEVMLRRFLVLASPTGLSRVLIFGAA